ncbi:helix-turn-helix domain-containing protein [Synechococcus sp. UW179A]|uniref:helix-turn-helix domain-containing protein n=1 Tax=Synechococcus sp. UW179A TaxID=2575510 RepID=UPI000E0E2144|nr:helix-turn-helix domain-containing protein [Synechococcus sp. UW179A]
MATIIASTGAKSHQLGGAQPQQSLDLPFHSASELKQLFKLIGKTFDAVQLSQGRLQGRFRLANLGSMALIELQTNQHLLLNGERGPDCMSFCLEATGLAEECRLFNIPIARYSLNGFRQGQIESHFQLSANSTIYLAILSTSRFNAFLGHCDSEDIIEQLETNNALQIDPLLHAQLRKKFQHFLECQPLTPQQRRQTTNHLYGSFLEAISNKISSKYLSYTPSPRQRLVREFVSWGFKNTDKDYNLDQISESLFASRRTLIQGTKESFGMGPMEMMKRVRLEQVNWILRSPDARADKRFRTISEIAQHYGFQSRGHFAKAYQQVFAESPSETWLKSANQ